MSPARTAGSCLDLEFWREQIPLLRDLIPMNHCSQAPQTLRANAAALEYLESWNRTGMDWEAWLAEVERARAAFADLIGARPEDIALSTSVSEAVSSLASALDFGGRRDSIVMSGAEFPTVRHVWLAQAARGARSRVVPVRDGMIAPQAWQGAIDERTCIVSACHAYYQNGFLQDVTAITRLAHEQGALMFVDAYQSLGTQPIDVAAMGVDFLASGCLKFLLGIPGLAFLYVRPGLVEGLQPTVTGWFGREEPFAFDDRPLDWAASARRFDTGTPPLLNAYVCRAGMDIIREVGLGTIQEAHTRLSQRLVDGGRARGLTVHGPQDSRFKTVTTAFVVPPESGKTSDEVARALLARGVIAAPRGPAVRLAPHFYTRLEEVDTALDLLTEALA